MTGTRDAASNSLADFYFSDSDDPLRPSTEWTDWRRDLDWAISLYEPSLLDGPRPITRMGHDPEVPVINMTSYNYLGLAHHPLVIQAAKDALDRYGAGACGSPMLSGMTDLHRELEKRLADFLGRADCLLFTSGYGGAVGAISGLLRRGDVALLDEKSHTSLVDGVKLSGARLVLFEHNNAQDLARQLARYGGARRIVAVEGLYSMDGSLGALSDVCSVAAEHGVGVLVDEAHSVLTIGKGGRGATEHFGCENDVVLQYGTFSKAFAGVGGFVAGPKDLLGYLRCFASSYAFSCALPPATVGGLLAALDVVQKEPARIEQLTENAAYFRAGLREMGLDTGDSTTHVVPIVIGSDRRTLYELTAALRQEGLFLAPVDYPSVPEDGLRFRASVTSAHDEADLRRALDIIGRVVVPRVTTAGAVSAPRVRTGE